MPMIFIGAYKMMGQARLRIADHLRKSRLAGFLLNAVVILHHGLLLI